MHAGKSHKFPEFLFWTRRSVYALTVLSTTLVVLHQVAGWKWLVVPWSVVLLLGTAVALMAGFKSTQTYGRTWEAQQIWSSITSKSRVWSEMSCGLLADAEESRILVYRHFAWLAALRYAMRERRPWETRDKTQNKEYERYYSVPEKENSLELELMKYLPCDEVAPILVASNKAARVLTMQNTALKSLLDGGLISAGGFMEMQRMVGGLHEQQGRSEMIKNSPYPRQYAIVNTIFVKILCFVLPLAMISQFDLLNEVANGFMRGNMVWLSIPMSVLTLWMFTSLDEVGESTSNPFEGTANDIPITQICDDIERELKEMLGETGLPSLRRPESEIVM
jgi:putative membrane protein